MVYGIPCLNCKKWYFGETTWTLDDRIEEGHKKDLRYIPKNAKRRTALVKHVLEEKHQFDFDNKKVMKKVRSRRTLKIHEVNQIILHEQVAVNQKSDAEHVSPEFYNLIMNSVKNKHHNVNPRKKQMTLTSVFE